MLQVPLAAVGLCRLCPGWCCRSVLASADWCWLQDLGLNLNLTQGLVQGERQGRCPARLAMHCKLGLAALLGLLQVFHPCPCLFLLVMVAVVVVGQLEDGWCGDWIFPLGGMS
jgi:hypothetical protein